MSSNRVFRPSRFTILTPHDAGGAVLYNSLRGSVFYVRDPLAGRVHDLLHNRSARFSADEAEAGPERARLITALAERGYVVPEDHDEGAEAKELRDARLQRRDTLELILMPTESCNFRCTYCYEDFALGRMLSGVREGVRELVRRRHAEGGLKALRVSWFGGEPLVAFDVIEELSEYFLEFAAANGIDYRAGMTTNGYLLTPDVAERCVDLGIRQLQITLDGPRHSHDASRPLMGGGATFDDIVANVRGLAESGLDFSALLRTNFSPSNVGSVPELLEELGGIVDGDDRFQVIFRPVGKWGGANDAGTETATGREAEDAKLALYHDAQCHDLPSGDTRTLRPGGSVCYAANPWSFLIRPNGIVNKCTVALRDARNMVGRLSPDGALNLDDSLMRLWTDNDEAHDTGCQACFFRPSCQGAHCPLIRIQDGVRPCPPQKVWIGPNLRTYADLAAERAKAAADV
ncbi:radical SAM protein [Streptomonospora sp. S1-112]|uniref:Radical SAM protein n=1 Tax=Streptomonospora mangrovi TaxID=2883123 RepID=A0A9X3SPA6_9ACTN|nr:radical SAM protein [Streptomonospora mangrovi]MDA0565661.1 radical SAM protein [Streptomonospora mangrovi]